MAGRSPAKNKISLFGNFGTLNIGNECTLQAIIHNIRRLLPETDINCICSIPEEVMATHDVPAFPMSRRFATVSPGRISNWPGHFILRILRGLFLRFPSELRDLARMRHILKGRDMLIMTGTGMLADSGGAALGLPYEIFKWTMMAKLCRLKVFFVSVGVERMPYRLTRWLIKLSLYGADYICYRDHQSRHYMTSIGFHKRSVVFPDLAFSLPETAAPAAPTAIAANPVIGVGLYDYCGGRVSQQDYHGYLKKIGDFVEWLVDREYPVRMLIGDITYDTAVREDLRKLLEKRGIIYADRQIIDEPITSVTDLFRQIESTDIVIASRFHNIIISLLLAKPLISISYNEKNDSLMAESGLSEYCLCIADFEVAGLIERVMEIEKHILEIPVRIMESTQEYRRALDEQYRLIFTTFLNKTSSL